RFRRERAAARGGRPAERPAGGGRCRLRRRRGRFRARPLPAARDARRELRIAARRTGAAVHAGMTALLSVLTLIVGARWPARARRAVLALATLALALPTGALGAPPTLGDLWDGNAHWEPYVRI